MQEHTLTLVLPIVQDGVHIGGRSFRIFASPERVRKLARLWNMAGKDERIVNALNTGGITLCSKKS